MVRSKNKISVDYGMPDYYEYFEQEYPELNIPRSKFNKIIGEVNDGIINLILNEGLEFKLPYLYTTFIIKKDKRKPKIKDGKVINNAPVDWKTTKKLWDEHPETKEKKLLVRYTNTHTSGYVFRIYFKKFGSHLKNRSYFKFKPSRRFQRALSARIKDDNKDKFDAYLLY